MLTRVILRDPDEACWYEYNDPVQVVTTSSLADVATTLKQVEDLVEANGWFAAGFVCYEAAAGFDAKLVTHLPDNRLPLVCFGLFAQRCRLAVLAPPHASEVHCAQPDQSPMSWQSIDTPASYRQRVDAIKTRIAAGETYQVNLTTQLHSTGQVNYDTFYRIAQAAPYGAFVSAEGFDIVSASPELFFQSDRHAVVCRPMKGTAPRGFSTHQDRRQSQWLQRSAKNRAENLMITDMVRNDLGRVAVPGSVQTTALFDVSAYSTVWQMTSTVTAQTPLGVTDLFRALFPGASITGAPKRASMAFIQQYESTARAVYTGAIGMLAPGRVARFNIAIRTAWSDKQNNTSCYGAGCGIVWDSDAHAEWRELQLKTEVLSTRQQAFRLIETMRGTVDGIYLLAAHLARLQASAEYFDFVIDTPAVKAALAKLELNGTVKVRLTLAADGQFDIETAELPQQPAVQPIMLTPAQIEKHQPWLYHKTTCREVYDRASRQVPADCEALLVNSEGRVTESAIANIVYQMDGELFTPPVEDGLLPGVLRSAEVAAGKVTERSLPVTQVEKVERWFLVNTLRGWRDACLREQHAPHR
ncbi:MAG: chorismate-binding protein [bacterium]